MRRMSDTTADLPALPPPAASEDIRRALADVDARLSAWAAVVAGSEPAAPKRAVAKPGPAPAPKPAEPVAAKPAPKVVEAPAAPAPPAASAEPEPVPEPAAPSPVARSADHEEDEALLASLDPETAQAIKVMRRLSFEDKSVRQLLEEYEQTRHLQGSSESRKKSWWSRG